MKNEPYPSLSRDNNCEVNFPAKIKTSQNNYLKTILSISEKYLKEEFKQV